MSIGDVVAPLGEARHAQRHDVQAVIEVLAEAAFRDLALEVAAGGGDDAHVDRHLLRAAEAQELLLDQHAQHLALRLERHVGDLVDVERAAVRLFERADLARRPERSSVPNSSSSTRSGAMAAALSTTKGPSARCDF